MANFLDIALNCIRRGWYVLPCVPQDKEPLRGLIPHGWHNASNEEAVIRRWWAAKPDANVGIACNPSKLAVVDCDHGNATKEDALAWMKRAGLPETYTVHTGRRFNPDTGEPEYGVQLYYAGSMAGVGEFSLAGGTGQVKSLDGYVMAAGSIHPISKEPYEVLFDLPIAPLPDVVRALKTEHKPVEDDGQPIRENRNIRLTSIAGKLRNAGLSAAALEVALLQVNADRCDPPLDDDEVRRIAANAAKWEMPKPDPAVTFGKPGEPEEPVDPWAKYHTFDEIMNVPDGRFIVDEILYENSITALAGYAGDRKSIISLNLAAACVTGQPFMGHFAVSNPPRRVIYLCPEMGLRELKKLAVSLGMVEHTKTRRLLFRSLDMAGKIRLGDLTPVELEGSLVILDTAVRFIEGKENDPQDMAAFSDELFRLRNLGATVWVLFHSSKASVGQELSLQNAVRGSSEIAAMLSMCWATRLNEPAKRFDSTSRMYPLKVREFDALPFDFGCDRQTAACRVLGDPAPVAVLKSRKDESARDVLTALVREYPTLGVNKLRELLKAKGHSKGTTSVRNWLAEIKGSGTVLTSE